MLNDLPSFSIVIETATQATSDLRHLKQALAALSWQTIALEHANEVIVVDIGTAPVEEIERVCGACPQACVRRFAHLADYFATQNAALPFITGEVVLFADSDCEYAPSWLGCLLEPFKDPKRADRHG